VATFGVLRNADYYRLSDLVQRFHERHPNVRIRLIGLNSVQVAAAVAQGKLDAVIVVLPIEDDGLRVTPTRRQLAERGQLAGLKLDPWIEVEHVEAALNLVSRGIGDTFISRAVAASSACPANVFTVPFDQPLYDTVAFIRRESSPWSPGTRDLARLAQQMLRSNPYIEIV
jgi:DNA-binding transcriptional LysR family regulator